MIMVNSRNTMNIRLGSIQSINIRVEMIHAYKRENKARKLEHLR